MIYIDSSVALAHLLAEPRSPPTSLWMEGLTSSALLEYEVWSRVNALGLSGSVAEEAQALAQALLNRTTLIELNQPALVRALEPWPIPLRTLDGLHLSAMPFCAGRARSSSLQVYDNRLTAAAQALGFPLATL